MSDFQRSAGEQGRRFEEAVEVLALIEGFTVVERRWRHPVVDIEVDLIIKRDDVGEVWLECKGSWESNRNSLQRTDTLKKAIANAAILAEVDDCRPYWLVASHLPRDGTAGATWLKVMDRFFDRVVVVSLTEGLS